MNLNQSLQQMSVHEFHNKQTSQLKNSKLSWGYVLNFLLRNSEAVFVDLFKTKSTVNSDREHWHFYTITKQNQKGWNTKWNTMRTPGPTQVQQQKTHFKAHKRSSFIEFRTNVLLHFSKGKQRLGWRWYCHGTMILSRVIILPKTFCKLLFINNWNKSNASSMFRKSFRS